MTQDVRSPSKRSRNKTTARRYADREILPPVQLAIHEQPILRDLNRVACASGEKLYTSTARRAIAVGVRVLLQESRRRPQFPRPT